MWDWNKGSSPRSTRSWEMARKANIILEAEIGVVGGEEDGVQNFLLAVVGVQRNVNAVVLCRLVSDYVRQTSKGSGRPVSSMTLKRVPHRPRFRLPAVQWAKPA